MKAVFNSVKDRMTATIFSRQLSAIQKPEVWKHSALFMKSSNMQYNPDCDALASTEQEKPVEKSQIHDSLSAIFSNYLTENHCSFPSPQELDFVHFEDWADNSNLGESREPSMATRYLEEENSIFSFADVIKALARHRQNDESIVAAYVYMATRNYYNKNAISQAARFRVSASELNKAVLASLRMYGFNAVICKTQWKSTSICPGGEHEYIEILPVSNYKGDRIIVDVSFRDHFTIAKPSPEYSIMVENLPEEFVGRADRLQQIINMMTEGMKRSAKLSGLHLPPWRKDKYFQEKWFSESRRTVPNDAFLSEDLLASRFENPHEPSDDLFASNYNNLPAVNEPREFFHENVFINSGAQMKPESSSEPQRAAKGLLSMALAAR